MYSLKITFSGLNSVSLSLFEDFNSQGLLSTANPISTLRPF